MTTVQLILKKGGRGETFSVSQERTIISSIKKLEEIINSVSFKENILSYSFIPRIGKKKYFFRMNQGLNRQQIYELIMSGKDNYSSSDYDLDFSILPYKTKPKVHAYTTKGSSNIYINQNYLEFYLKTYSESKVIAALCKTLMHEYLHNLGFKHRGNKTSRYNDTTVPYAIGKIVYGIIVDKKADSFELVIEDIFKEFKVSSFCNHTT